MSDPVSGAVGRSCRRRYSYLLSRVADLPQKGPTCGYLISRLLIFQTVVTKTPRVGCRGGLGRRFRNGHRGIGSAATMWMSRMRRSKGRPTRALAQMHRGIPVSASQPRGGSSMRRRCRTRAPRRTKTREADPRLAAQGERQGRRPPDHQRGIRRGARGLRLPHLRRQSRAHLPIHTRAVFGRRSGLVNLTSCG
jgi:hypothetical protein